MEEKGDEVPVCDPYCIFCGSVVIPKKKTFLYDPNFYSVWTHLCTAMKVPTATRDSLYDRLMNGEGTFCKKTCLPLLIGISKLLHQISNLQGKLEEKTTEIRNRVVAASALDKHSDVDEESLVYSFRLLISRHFKDIKRHTRKSGPCQQSKKSPVTKKISKAPPGAPEEPAQKCGIELRIKPLAAVEVMEEEELETETDNLKAGAEAPSTASTTEVMECSPEEETTSNPPPASPEEKPKRQYKLKTPRETSGSLKCPECPLNFSFSSSAAKITSRQNLRSHYHTEHFYKKLISREDLQKTSDGKDYFLCPSCPVKVFLKYHKVMSQANREHTAITALRNHFLQSHEGEPKLSGKMPRLHGGFVRNAVLPEFNLAAAEENVDFFRCPFGGCDFVSQVIDPLAPYPYAQEHRRSAILRVSRHYLKFHDALVNFEKTRRNPAVVRDPETQGEILKCPKCEFKLDYISRKQDAQKSTTNQLKFAKHYASHILPLYTNRPNLYEKNDEL